MFERLPMHSNDRNLAKLTFASLIAPKGTLNFSGRAADQLRHRLTEVSEYRISEFELLESGSTDPRRSHEVADSGVAAPTMAGADKGFRSSSGVALEVGPSGGNPLAKS
jgi:hypothetical protein